jgi:hypothetical protein
MVAVATAKVKQAGNMLQFARLKLFCDFTLNVNAPLLDVMPPRADLLSGLLFQIPAGFYRTGLFQFLFMKVPIAYKHGNSLLKRIFCTTMAADPIPCGDLHIRATATQTFEKINLHFY